MEIGIGVVLLLIGAGIAVLVMRNAKTGSIREAEDKIQSAHAEAEQVMGDARRAADTLKKEALLEAKGERSSRISRQQRPRRSFARRNFVSLRIALCSARNPLIVATRHSVRRDSFPASRAGVRRSLVS